MNSRKQICREFARKGTCHFKNCKFEHSASHSTNKREISATKRGWDRNTTRNHSELDSWRRQAREGKHGRLLGQGRASFFQRGRQLITTSDDALQEVIHSLSSEGGLRRIQELIQRDYSDIPDAQKRNLFQDQILPFVEIVTYPGVLVSLVVEQAVVTIYNCIWGPMGRRGEPFLNFLAEAVQQKVVRHDGDATSSLEMSVLVFSKIVELNSTAFVHEPLKEIAVRFHSLFMTLWTPETEVQLESSHIHLKHLQRRLDIGLSLPELFQKPKPALANRSPATFTIAKAPAGGRHNNDHADICKIQIMPTYQEILSPQSEYLPSKDPVQWHLSGLAGLLDRNFRLLREDTIGQLRDVIHKELNSKNSRGLQRSQVRTNVYQQAKVQELIFDRYTGLQFFVQFAQPPNVQAMRKEQKKEWWELSKRLQPSALVCLTDSRGFAIFCTVADRPRQPLKNRNSDLNIQQKVTKTASLWEDSRMASVSLELVDQTERNQQYILDCYSVKNGPFLSLVEFPGILLPSFKPTLLALQKMQKAADLPMADFVVPLSINTSSGVVDVRPPAYAMAPDFSFDLSCLMDEKSSLKVRASRPVDMGKLKQHSTLDDAQAAALVNSLQRRLALIQGPPGTGKSYTGVALIKVLLANKKKVKRPGLGPIICVCYTNHALDQLLEDLLDNDITSQIIRIGSQSKSEALKALNLRAVARNVVKTRLEKSRQYELQRRLDEYEESFSTLQPDMDMPDGRLNQYLKSAHPNHYNQFFGKDEMGFQKQGKPRSIIRSWLYSGKNDSAKARELDILLKSHVDSMSAVERRTLHSHWVETRREELHSEVQDLLRQHQKTRSGLDSVRDELDLRCLRDADVIGVTTTGLARNLEMLRRLHSKVVLCEEAGEVLEPHLLTSFLPSVEHVILIGDHQQLRPQIQNYGLSRESKDGQQYSLDTSLFERLVDPDDGSGLHIPFCTLETQRRMHPSIAQLVRETLYPRLQDAPSVSEYPEVMGMRRRLFWLDHRHYEGGNSDHDAMATSHWNDYEIDMTVGLVNHLLRQGTYQSGDIAVLTPYLGQLHRMRRKLSQTFMISLGERDEEDLDKAGFTEENAQLPKMQVTKSTLLQTLRAATIDNFQGEEAKVVVISLVRSNHENRCGFLRTPNRINVLLSRAKHGMYIIGNSETAEKGVEMWRQTVEILDRHENFGSALELKCPRHSDTPIAVSEPGDFVQFSPEGGCSLVCGKRLQCGHPCKQKCHADLLHKAVYCIQPCPRPQKGCDHPCPKPCGDPCPKKCLVSVVDAGRTLPCGHLMASLPCWQSQDLSTVKCPTYVKRKVPTCNHSVTDFCHVDVQGPDYKCKSVCQTILPCGHSCKRRCSDCRIRTPEGVQVDHGSCRHKCGRIYSTCAHVCASECHGENPCPPCASECDVQCGHSRCSRKCSEPCAPCAVPKCLSACAHSACSMPCAAPCDHVPCSLRCSKALPCGHQCPSVCGELCPDGKFCQVCATDEIKNTSVDFILGQSYMEIDLNETPCIFPPCGHFLTMESMDAQMDIKKHYITNEKEQPVAIATSSEPFSITDIRSCATCRGSLRSISRYGRLVRRALLDESTKKFILYLNQRYIPLAQELPKCLARLQELEKTATMNPFPNGGTVMIGGPRDHQVRLMSSLIWKCDKKRWGDILHLRQQLLEYYDRVKVDEQPYNQVRNMVEDVRRRKQRVQSRFEFDESVLQTKGLIQATALLLRLDTALLADFLSLRARVDARASNSELLVSLKANRLEAKNLITMAAGARRVLPQVEGYLFLAQLCALEMQRRNDETQTEALLKEGNEAVVAAKELVARHPQLTHGMQSEISGTEKMLRGTTFYTPVTDEERMGVVAAMAREFAGTGHWYYCQNGHPFTIGECGGAMELSTCPECGAAVGGQHHQTTSGVTRANDLEEGLGRLAI